MGLFTDIFDPLFVPLFTNITGADIDYSLYNYYVNFDSGKIPKDLISNQSMQTNELASGRVSYVGGPYGINEPALDEYGLFGCGVIDNDAISPNDLTAWNSMGGAILTVDTITLVPNVSYVNYTSSLIAGTYTFSFEIKSFDGSDGTWCMNYYNGAHNRILKNITGEWSTVVYTFTSASPVQLIYIGDSRSNASTILKAYIRNIQVTATPYRLPFIEGLSPENYSDADQGYKFSLASLAQLKIALNGTDGTDAQGKLTCKWRPMFDSGDLTGTINILTTNEEASTFLFFDADNNLLKLTDGTNTSQIACSPVTATVYEITGQWDETNGMVVSLDGLAGTTATFVGSIPNADDLSYFWNAAVPQYVKIITIEKESGL